MSFINKGQQKKAYMKLIKTIGFEKGEVVFDAGCGSGYLGNFMNNVVLIGGDLDVDVDDELPKGYSGIFQCDLEQEIPLTDNSVDTVISISVFQYLHEIDKAFKECMRIARKRIIINIPNPSSIFYTLDKMHHLSWINKDILEKLGKNYQLKTNIFYFSNKFNFLRQNKHLAGGIVAIYSK